MRTDDVLTPDAVAFVTDLQREFGERRREALARRVERAGRLADGELPDFLPETREVRDGDWRIAPFPDEIADRRVEITGPVDRKMVINALNSGVEGVHGGLRGRQLAHVGELHRGAAQPHRRARADDRARHRREALRARARPGGALRAPARLAPRGAPLRGRRRSVLRLALRLRALLLPQPRAKRARTSTSRSSSLISRRDSGTTSSPGRRSDSASSTARSRRPS